MQRVATITAPELRHKSDTGAQRRMRLVTTPAGIVIGGAYTPPPRPLPKDAETIQGLLLNPRRPGPVTLTGLLWRHFVRWC